MTQEFSIQMLPGSPFNFDFPMAHPSFETACPDITQTPEWRQYFKDQTGLDLPENDAQWIELAAQFDYHAWPPEGSLDVYWWVIGKCRKQRSVPLTRLENLPSNESDFFSSLPIETERRQSEELSQESIALKEIDSSRELAPAYLGVILDHDKREIRRDGYQDIVDLSNRPSLWHTFRIFFECGSGYATLEKWRNNYPGEWDARHQVVHDLKKTIAPLGLTIPRKKRQIAATSDIS